MDKKETFNDVYDKIISEGIIDWRRFTSSGRKERRLEKEAEERKNRLKEMDSKVTKLREAFRNVMKDVGFNKINQQKYIKNGFVKDEENDKKDHYSFRILILNRYAKQIFFSSDPTSDELKFQLYCYKDKKFIDKCESKVITSEDDEKEILNKLNRALQQITELNSFDEIEDEDNSKEDFDKKQHVESKHENKQPAKSEESEEEEDEHAEEREHIEETLKNIGFTTSDDGKTISGIYKTPKSGRKFDVKLVFESISKTLEQIYLESVLNEGIDRKPLEDCYDFGATITLIDKQTGKTTEKKYDKVPKDIVRVINVLINDQFKPKKKKVAKPENKDVSVPGGVQDAGKTFSVNGEQPVEETKK